KEQPIAAFWIGRRIEAPAVEERPPLALVGRTEELEALRAAVDSARRRQSALVELVGEPGIGKSRLVEELRTLAVGFQQLSARGEEYESATPFHALRDLLRPLVGITAEMSPQEAGALLVPWVEGVMPDLAPWLPLLAIPFDADVPPTPETEEIDPAFRQRKVHEVVEQLLQRLLVVPTLLVFEDVHWVDDASRFLLRQLTATPGPRPWLVCATRRPEGETLVRDGNGTVLELAPLPPESATELALAALEDWALPGEEFAALVERSGGNPLFVRELVAARTGGAHDALPDTVEAVITARIDRLDRDDRLLLRCAAVIGTSFDVDLLAELLAVADDPERWDRLGEFVGREDGRLRFRHDLFRTVAYESLSYRRRAELHRSVGEALERRGGGDESAALLSVHFFAAGEHAKAWEYAVAAADRARARFANVDAAELYERALACAEHLALTEDALARVAEGLGDVCELAARYDAASAAYGRARELVPESDPAHARLLLKEGVLRERQGRYAEALDWYARGLAVLDAADETPESLSVRVELELETAVVRHRQGVLDECLRWSRVAAEHARAAGDRSALAHTYRLLAAADPEAADGGVAHLERALALYEEIGDWAGAAIVLGNLGIRAYYAGDWQAALERYRDGRERLRRAGDVVRAANLTNNEAEILLDQGRVADAEELLTVALRVYRSAGYPLGAGVATLNLGRCAAQLRRFEEAEELIARALAAFAELGSDGFGFQGLARKVECLVFAGRHGEARSEAEAAADAPGGTAILRAQLERAHGYALAQARELDEARAHFEESLRLAREGGADFELALTSKALADTGLDPDAASAAAEALARLGVVATPYVPLP
ncbi:MAG TPA: tetratricopeptide repeat protein, partial [Gaiellaceae bacterium]